MLLYPVGTWGYTWWQQRLLANELVEAHPALAESPIEEFFVKEDMTLVGAEQRELVKAGLEAERLSQQRALRQASLDYAESLVGGGGEPLGRLLIPRIGLDVVMIEGTGTADLREGPGHWPETPLPGMGGNFVVSGHRTTYGAPFFKLNQLEPGDEIQVLLPFAALTYQVTRTMIVLPTETEVVAQRGIEEVSLTTCEPIYSASRRLIVQAELSGFRLIEADRTLESGLSGD
ncbi:MAG: class E sortase [Thermoleophilia bacterium]|nr:class E sortase [Thermoleophilia bacterium]